MYQSHVVVLYQQATTLYMNDLQNVLLLTALISSYKLRAMASFMFVRRTLWQQGSDIPAAKKLILPSYVTKKL